MKKYKNNIKDKNKSRKIIKQIQIEEITKNKFKK